MKLLRFLLTLLHLLLLVILAATMLNAIISPDMFPVFNFLSLAFPFLMIGNVLLCFVWIFSWKKRAFVFLLITTLFLTPIRRWVNYSDQPKVHTDFKLLSFNNNANHYGKENVESYINSFNADVVFLQEAGYQQLGKPMFKSLEYSIHYPIISFYSKYKILEQGNIPLDDIGNALYADVKIKEKRIRFINVYLAPFQLHRSMVRPTSDINQNEEKAKGLIKRFIPVFKTHQQQVETIKKMVQNSPYPVVLAGDFNAVPNSYEYYTIAEVLEDCFLNAGNGFSTSFHDYKFPIRIDYIFASKDIKPLTYLVDRTQKQSDHFPVIATFSLKTTK